MFEIAGGIILAALFFAFLPLLIIAAYRAIPVLFVTAIVMVVTVLTVATLPYSIGLWVLFLAYVGAYQLSRRYFPGLWKPATKNRKPPGQGKLRPWPPQFVAEQRRLEQERRNKAAQIRTILADHHGDVLPLTGRTFSAPGSVMPSPNK